MVVLAAGFGTTVQDCGRFGYRKFGVAAAGALDFTALRVANLLVGNDECAAGLEIASGRVRLQFTDDRLVAWSGGSFLVGLGANPIPALHCARASAGATCEISPGGGRAWLAVSGGIDVPEVLGSRSTDLRAAFGGLQGRALRDGDELPLGEPSSRSKRIATSLRNDIADWSGPPSLSSQAQRASFLSSRAQHSPFLSSRAQRSEVEGSGEKSLKLTPRHPSTALVTTLRVARGQHWSPGAGDKFLATQFRVALNSDRMGLRLESDVITSEIGELVSEAVVPGTIQLPPDGAPILLLADCQTIGGYPKLAHLITVDLARAAQLQPLDEIRFELTTLDYAQELLRQRERDIALFRAGLQARFG